MLRKKIFAAILSTAIVFSSAAISTSGFVTADAVTFSQVNDSSVFVKQQESDTCTLASNVMLLRRTAMMRGDSDWSSITERACRSTLWVEDVGMYHDYSYKGISVSYRYISGSSRSELINALKEHPEGIVAYDYDYPHAILLTDYTNGVFYCADPARNVPSGRMNVSNALIRIDNVDTYWYVTSPKVSFSDSEPGGTGTDVNEKWRITSDNGVNMRSGAGTSYGVVGGVPYNAVVTVKKKTTADGYTWGYITYNSVSGWIALDYAEKVTNNLTNNSTISAKSVTLGKSLTITGKGSGGTGTYTYSAYYKRKTATVWSKIRDYSTNPTITMKPAAATDYDIRVKVKDSAGSVVNKDFTISVTKALANNSTISAKSVTLGKSLTITGKGSGGTGTYTYSAYYKRKTATVWSKIRDYSTNPTITMKPAAATDYDIRVKVKDSTGSVVNKDFTISCYKN